MEIASPRAGATPKQPSIGRERQGDPAELCLGFYQRGRALFPVDLPLRHRAVHREQLVDVLRFDDVGRQDAPAPAEPAVRLKAIEGDRQRVSLLSALDEKRPGLWVPRGGDGLPTGIPAPGVDGAGDDGVAIRDSEDRLVGADGHVIMGRLKLMQGHGCSWLPPRTGCCRGRRTRLSVAIRHAA